MGDDCAFTSTCGNKGILHRYPEPDAAQCLIETLDSKTFTAKIPRGYRCATVAHLKHAHQLLLADGVTEFCLKPIWGAGGQGILFLKHDVAARIVDYGFPYGECLLEERLTAMEMNDTDTVSITHHFIGLSTVGSVCDELLNGTTWAGAVSPSCAPEELVRQAQSSACAFITAFQPQGPGGLGFFLCSDHAYLIDINGGRYNGTHYGKLFAKTYAPSRSFVLWQNEMPLEVNITEVYTQLQDAGIAFAPVKDVTPHGVFPIVHLKGIIGIYVAVASTVTEARALHKHAVAVLQRL